MDMSDQTAGARAKIIEALELSTQVTTALHDAMAALDGEATGVPGLGTWNIGRLEDLWRLTDGLPGAAALLDTCRVRPDTWVPFADIVGNGRADTVRSELARFGRLLNDNGFPHRPFLTKQVAELGYKQGYKIPDVLAEMLGIAKHNVDRRG
jgi:hypothetical protein